MNLAKFLYQQRNPHIDASHNSVVVIALAEDCKVSGIQADIHNDHSVITTRPFVSLTNKPIATRSSPLKLDESRISSRIGQSSTTVFIEDDLVEAKPSGSSSPAPRYHLRKRVDSKAAASTLKAKPTHVAGTSQSVKRQKKKSISEVIPDHSDDLCPGPRHLEYDYSLAQSEFTAMLYRELAKLGYQGHIRPSLKGKERAVPWTPTAEHQSILKQTVAYKKASKKLNNAYCALTDALARGETWENTDVPKEFTWENKAITDYINLVDNSVAPDIQMEGTTSYNATPHTEVADIETNKETLNRPGRNTRTKRQTPQRKLITLSNRKQVTTTKHHLASQKLPDISKESALKSQIKSKRGTRSSKSKNCEF